MISGKVSYGKKGFKNFIGYKEDQRFKPLCIMFPKMSEYVKCSDESKYISFSIKDGELAEKYNKTWNKVSNIIKKGFDKRTVYDAKYISTKIKSYNGKISTNFITIKYLKNVLVAFVYQ